MITKALGIGCALLAILVMYYRGEMLSERVSRVAVTAERDNLKTVVSDVVSINERTSSTLDFTLTLHSNQIGKTDEYLEQIQGARDATAAAILELDDLRRDENERALAEPFERGDAARARLTLSLCRAWGLGPSDDARCGSTGGDGDGGARARHGASARADADGAPDSGDDAQGG